MCFNSTLLCPVIGLSSLIQSLTIVFHNNESRSSVFTPQISYIFQTVEPFIIDSSFFFSLMRYTPNPGGGARGARQTGAAPGRGRATSCSVCSNSGLPIVDAICPFHQHQTEGLVRRSAIIVVDVSFLVRSVCYAVHACVVTRSLNGSSFTPGSHV